MLTKINSHIIWSSQVQWQWQDNDTDINIDKRPCKNKQRRQWNWAGSILWDDRTYIAVNTGKASAGLSLMAIVKFCLLSGKIMIKTCFALFSPIEEHFAWPLFVIIAIFLPLIVSFQTYSIPLEINVPDVIYGQLLIFYIWCTIIIGDSQACTQSTETSEFLHGIKINSQKC